MNKAKRDKKSKQAKLKKMRRSLGAAIKNRWPELANPLHPEAGRIMAAEGDKIIAYVKRFRTFKAFASLYKQAQADSKRARDAERQWVKAQRVLRTLENVALAANLMNEAEPNIQQRYRQLKEAEASTFLSRVAPQARGR